ncbi:hypothetical protein GGF46_002000 [Coemansia sp. RSA 552]|nr:hypothetical protein GGF46_002000 [Coemansia sp. RSA 552]
MDVQTQGGSDERQTPTTGAGVLANGLTQAQQESVDRARAYAQELQETVFKDVVEAERQRREEALRPVPGTVNPGLLGGVDERNLSLMSRLYVGSINFELTEEHIHQVFSEFGSVRSVSMSKDAATGRHKGFGFVEFDVPEAASLAMEAMNGTMLGGRQLKIGRPNNYNVAVMQGFPEPPKERIYVASINEAIPEAALCEIFAPFGDVRQCVLAPDMALRRHKGWGFIEFADGAAAEQAVLAMNGFSLGNQTLRVGRCVVGGPLGEGMGALDAVPSAAPAVQPPQQVMDVVASINKSIGIEEPAASINKGVGAEKPASISQGVGAEEPADFNKNAEEQATGSSVVLLGNVVGGRAEVDDGLAEDMAGEGTKCGRIAKVVVHVAGEEEGDQQSEVSIFVQYTEPGAAASALELFDGRWFGGRQITATLFDPDRYRVLTSADTMVFIP